MERDDPAVAESIVVHAETLCEREDHLWDVINQLSIPLDLLTDHRDQSKAVFETEEMVRAFLYKEIRGFSQSGLAEELGTSSSLVKSCGFNIKDLGKSPSQQDLSYAWGEFSGDTKEIIEAAATSIADVAVEHGVISEGLVPSRPSDDIDQSGQSQREYKREHSTRTIRLARSHMLPEFKTGRAPHRIYSDEELHDMLVRACERKGSAHSEGEYGWLIDDDQTCAGSTLLRAIKKIATPEEMDAQFTLSDFADEDAMPRISRIRDSIMESFDAATDNIINSIRGENPFDQGRKTIAAIDITHEQFHASPWEDKDKGIVKEDFPPMVSGYKKDGEYKRGFKYATITLVGDHAPIILGVEPVKENSKWEPDGSPSFSKADLVDRLLDKAERFVDLDEVLFDRGFYSNEVYARVHDRDLIYTSPVPMYKDDYEAIEDIEAHDTADAAVKHDVPFGHDGEVHHHAEFMYVPSQSDDANGKYAVFVTNRDRVGPEEVKSVCNGYRRRWDIENQYKSVKSFLAKTSSKDYRVRLCNFVFASLIYNLWRLTDYLIKVALDKEIRSPPVLTAKTFVRALGEFLREVD
ncbi:transposase [Halobacterium litoreum]|uniref:Transposase n=1 Tax=Halobacterium litoreum TaxID=2039234 RepID=A0ABD5NF09_9EURY|nr:transposase [Halobacterium litoreum]UHH13400.1 transposase [Halobacterium litoreum]